jgi:hypothetical protein
MKAIAEPAACREAGLQDQTRNPMGQAAGRARGLGDVLRIVRLLYRPET